MTQKKGAFADLNRDLELERRQHDVDFASGFVDPVKRTCGSSFTTSHVVTVVGEAFPGGEAWRFADDFITFDH